MSASSYLGSSWVPTWVTLAGFSVTVFVIFSSGTMVVLETFGEGKPESSGDPADFSSSFTKSRDAIMVSARSQLSRRPSGDLRVA